MSTERQHVTVDDAGRVVGSADLDRVEASGVVRADLYVEAGHLPVGSRARLVDAVLAQPDVQGASELQAAVPAGDSEIVERLVERCEDVQLRTAGATLLVDARLTPPATPATPSA